MKTIFLPLLSLAIYALPTCAHAQLTPKEDTSVRSAYARLSLATEVDAIEKNKDAPVSQLKAVLAFNSLKYEIVTLTGGPIADILNENVSDYFRPPAGDILNVSPGISTYTDYVEDPKGITMQETRASASWIVGPTGEQQKATWTLAEAFAREPAPHATRYGKAIMIVTLAGQSVTYKAMYLFGAHGIMAVLDPVTGPGAVMHFVNPEISVYPKSLMEGRWRGKSIVQAWIGSTQISGCTANGKSECCDAANLRCGMTPEDVKTSITKLPASVRSTIAQPVSQRSVL